MSCGALDTPKLLMLSGIGPAEQLREVGVEVAVDSAGVGENLQDRPKGVIMWDAKQPMTTTSSQRWEAGMLCDTEPGLDRPDLMFHYGSVPFDMNTARWGYPTSENAFCLRGYLARRIAAQPALSGGGVGPRAGCPDGRGVVGLHPQDPQHRLSPGLRGEDGRG